MRFPSHPVWNLFLSSLKWPLQFLPGFLVATDWLSTPPPGGRLVAVCFLPQVLLHGGHNGEYLLCFLSFGEVDISTSGSSSSNALSVISIVHVTPIWAMYYPYLRRRIMWRCSVASIRTFNGALLTSLVWKFSVACDETSSGEFVLCAYGSYVSFTTIFIGWGLPVHFLLGIGNFYNINIS